MAKVAKSFNELFPVNQTLSQLDEAIAAGEEGRGPPTRPILDPPVAPVTQAIQRDMGFIFNQLQAAASLRKMNETSRAVDKANVQQQATQAEVPVQLMNALSQSTPSEHIITSEIDSQAEDVRRRNELAEAAAQAEQMREQQRQAEGRDTMPPIRIGSSSASELRDAAASLVTGIPRGDMSPAETPAQSDVEEAPRRVLPPVPRFPAPEPKAATADRSSALTGMISQGATPMPSSSSESESTRGPAGQMPPGRSESQRERRRLEKESAKAKATARQLTSNPGITSTIQNLVPPAPIQASTYERRDRLTRQMQRGSASSSQPMPPPRKR